MPGGVQRSVAGRAGAKGAHDKLPALKMSQRGVRGQQGVTPEWPEGATTARPAERPFGGYPLPATTGLLHDVSAGQQGFAESEARYG